MLLTFREYYDNNHFEVPHIIYCGLGYHSNRSARAIRDTVYRAKAYDFERNGADISCTDHFWLRRVP